MDARAWAKKVDKDPAESRALVALSKLKPSDDKKGRVQMPMPVGEDAPYDKVLGHKSLKRRIGSAPVEKVPTSKLVTNGQKTVRVDQVEHYIGAPKAAGTPHGGGKDHGTDHPIVVKVGGHHVLFDGHHRATAAILRGDNHIDARVVDLDGPKPKE